MNRKDFHRYLTEVEERRLFGAIAERAGGDTHAQRLAKRDLNAFRLLRYTGIRVGALAGLSVEDARAALAAGHLVLRDAISKRGQGGQVHLTKKARAALQALLTLRRTLQPAPGADTALLVSRNRKGLSVRSLQARMAHWRAVAGLEAKASPHWWRHTLAKRLMKNSTADDPRGIVQAALGHRSITSTAVYTLPDKEQVASALEEVN